MAFPRQTPFIIGNEACERFSYYGMRSILVLYMVNMLAMDESSAMEVIHLFSAAIYVLPLLGAWIADRFWGRYNTILYVSLFYCLGHGVLAMADLTESVEIQRNILFTGLSIIAIGAGGIKPCVSAFVGDQVDGQPSETITRVYAAFYWAINLGSFFSFLVIPFVRQSVGYGWAFGIPGIFMALATLIFWLGRHRYIHKQPTQPEFLRALATRILRGAETAVERFGAEKTARTTNTAIGIMAFIVIAPLALWAGSMAKTGGLELAQLCGVPAPYDSLCALFSLLLYIVVLVLACLKLAASLEAKNFFGTCGSMIFNRKEVTEQLYTPEQRKEARNMVRVLTAFLLIIPFWSLYDQTMSSWVLQGRDMTPVQMGSFKFGAEEMQSINPLLVMILVPLVTLLVYPYIGKWSAPLKRMGCGIVLAGAAYGAVAWLQHRMDMGESLCILWQILPYFILTVSEILVSTTGLEYAYTAAGKNLKSIVMSFWLLTSTLGNLLVVYLTSLVTDPASTATFMMYGAMSIVVGLIFILVTSRKSFAAEA